MLHLPPRIYPAGARKLCYHRCQQGLVQTYRLESSTCGGEEIKENEKNIYQALRI
jgi:hypothetical protein